MGALVFVLALVLLAAGGVSGYLSLDLLPTGPGLLYALAGAVAGVGAIVAFALGVVAVRVGRLAEAVRAQTAAADAVAGLARTGRPDNAPPPGFAAAHEDAFAQEESAEAAAAAALQPAAAFEAGAAPGGEEAEPAAGVGEAGASVAAGDGADEDEAPINENRAGHLPTLEEIEQAIETPEAPPTLIGRYSAGGATYMIFSDGSIEAETDEGAFKFASMGDFKQFLKDRGASKP